MVARTSCTPARRMRTSWRQLHQRWRRPSSGRRSASSAALMGGGSMFVVRDIMYCKPGKVRPMVEKFVALSKLSQKLGFGTMRVMTDVSAERYWMVVSEMEVESLQQHAEMSQKSMQMPEFQDVM